MKSQEDFELFVKGLDKFIRKKYLSTIQSAEAEIKDLESTYSKLSLPRKQGRNIRTQEYLEKQIVFSCSKITKKNDIIQLAILSWYLPEWHRFELQELLRKKCSQINFFELKIYLESKRIMQRALSLEIHVDQRTLFGNILSGKIMGDIVFDSILNKKIIQTYPIHVSLKYQFPRKAKKQERVKGYQDHGSLSSLDSRVRRHEFQKESSRLEQERLQNLLKIKIHYLQLLRKIQAEDGLP